MAHSLSLMSCHKKHNLPAHGAAVSDLDEGHEGLSEPTKDTSHIEDLQNVIIISKPEFMGSFKLGNVWGFVQLIHRPMQSKKSAKQKTKHCLTWDFLSALLKTQITKTCIRFNETRTHLSDQCVDRFCHGVVRHGRHRHVGHLWCRVELVEDGELIRQTIGGGILCLGYVLSKYRVVKLNFTPEIEAFYMLFERSLSIFSNISQTAYSVKSSWANLYKDIERL